MSDDTNQAPAPAAPTGAFPITLVDSEATAYGIENAAGWYDFAAGKFSADAFDATKHTAPAAQHPTLANVKRLAVPAGIHALGPFAVYAFRGAAVVQVMDYGVEGIPWTMPTTGTIVLAGGTFSAANGAISLK